MVRDYDAVYQTIDDGGVMATVPGLRGAVTQGRTMAEARRNIREVIETPLDLYGEQTPNRGCSAASAANYPRNITPTAATINPKATR